MTKVQSYKGVKPNLPSGTKGVTQPGRGHGGPDGPKENYGGAGKAASTYRSSVQPLTGAHMKATGSHLSVSTSKLLAKRGTNGPNG